MGKFDPAAPQSPIEQHPIEQPPIVEQSRKKQKDPPRVGIKLTPAAQEVQKKDPKHILEILEKSQAGAASDARAYRLFHTRTPEEIESLVDRAVHCDKSYQRVDLNSWHQVYLQVSDPINTDVSDPRNIDKPPPFSDPCNVDSLVVSLLKHPEVENAYALRTGPPPGPQFPLDANSYLDSPAKYGLDVMAAWDKIGNATGITAGKGVKVIDIEGGWYRTPDTVNGTPVDKYNDDLPLTIKTLNSYVEDATCWHGNNVLGVLFMMPGNGCDGSGIAPGGQGYTMGHTFEPPADGLLHAVNIAGAILESLVTTQYADSPGQFLLRPGDVILLETSTASNSVPGVSEMMPSECEPPVFALIRIATALGIIVVEAAGNGNQDLAKITVDGKSVFDSTKPDEFRDSGAIIVGACDPATLERWEGDPDGSNYGSRVDVFAWGDQVWTTGRSGDNSVNFPALLADYCPDKELGVPPFGGTSAATAIIAGAVMLIQGYAQQKRNGFRFSPAQMRELLKTNGTPSKDEGQEDTKTMIGVMPKLTYVLHEVGSVPDIYIRHNQDDKGDGSQALTMENCFSSPDILLNWGSGTDQTVGVTLYNRGNVDATDVTVDLYWLHKSDLFDVTKWTKIKSGTIANVAARGESDGKGTVSFSWPSSHGPTGNMTDLCLIAVISCPSDPGMSVSDLAQAVNSAPELPQNQLRDAKEKIYLKFLASNNNMAQLKFYVGGSAS